MTILINPALRQLIVDILTYAVVFFKYILKNSEQQDLPYTQGASGGQGVFLKKHPLEPQKTFNETFNKSF